MDVVGSQIGQKMRSAIKAKLTELGCYVDDELPDYVMVMVANKRTRSQMEEDLQLFLGDNTESFVNWLHQVLKKLQEVTVTAPLKQAEKEKDKEKAKSREHKSKDKKSKDRSKKDAKKAKKRIKEKKIGKKIEKRKNKKKSKHHDILRPNIPPMLMNMEKESEPSITDVFAGQILKNHGVLLDIPKEPIVEQKPEVITEIKRPIKPIIDPATISQPNQSSLDQVDEPNSTSATIEPTQSMSISVKTSQDTGVKTSLSNVPTENKIKEMHEIEAKIQGLKQKLADQLDSMSDDEDFLNIRTEAEELMNDFAEDVYQEISQPPPANITPPLRQKSPFCPSKSPDCDARSKSPTISVSESPELTKSPVIISKSPEQYKTALKELPETLPQIELNLPKRPIRERLGSRTEAMNDAPKQKVTSKRAKTPERYTPEKEFRPTKPAKSRFIDVPDKKVSSSEDSDSENSDSSLKKSASRMTEKDIRSSKSAKSRLGDFTSKKTTVSDESDTEKADSTVKKLTSRVTSVTESNNRRASVVRVRPRPRVGQASSLLLKAVADAHKSLLNIPPKPEQEPVAVKRALVLPMRRTVDPQKIVIQVPADRQPSWRDRNDSDKESRLDKESKEAVPPLFTKKFVNTDYVPCNRKDVRTTVKKDDSLIIETLNIHKTGSVNKDRSTQFIVTMDGIDSNAFLAKKLATEGLLDDDEELSRLGSKNKANKEKTKQKEKNTEGIDLTRETDLINKHVFQSKSENSEKEMNFGKVLPNFDEAVESENVNVNVKCNDSRIDAKSNDSKISAEHNNNDNCLARGLLDKENHARQTTYSASEFMERSPEKKSDQTTNTSQNKDLTEVDSNNLNRRRLSDVEKSGNILIKRLSHTSEDSETQVIIKSDKDETKTLSSAFRQEQSEVKKRRASPIVFDVAKKEKDVEKTIERQRTESASSDNVVTVTTTVNSHKYDTVPSLSSGDRKLVPCRAFPLCRFGAACAFVHPRCRFGAACSRRNCPYSHTLAVPTSPALPISPVIASHVVPAANYKSISSATVSPAMCKFYPNCSNPACHYFHPKPCRYGKACINKPECNFYHGEGSKFRFPV